MSADLTEPTDPFDPLSGVLARGTALDDVAWVAARHGLAARGSIGPSSATWGGASTELVLARGVWGEPVVHVRADGTEVREDWAAEFSVGSPLWLISTAVAGALAPDGHPTTPTNDMRSTL